MRTRFFTRRFFWLSVSLVTVLAVLFMMLATTPQEAGPGGVIVWFGLAYIIVVTLPTVLHAYLLSKTEHISWHIAAQWCLLGFGLLGVLGLRSLGQLQARDLLLVVILLTLLALYLWRARKQMRKQP